MSELATKYDPLSIEDRIYAYWMEHKLFKSVPDDREPFTIVIPPPNVTGVLHMGHMLNNTIQDLLVRRARMQGKNALWVPGTDHASIATEAKVVQKLRAEGIKKSDLSRDAFLEHAWEWTHKHGGIILEQLKKLGASCDWDRTRFTMDEKYYESVVDSFIDLHKKGKIYRGERMINWDPAALTALSDEEVIYREVNSKLYHVKYQIVDTNEFITIATTRPETILGDTAICVNPKDERYKHLHGKKAIVPIVGRAVPIIADDYVEMEFGTGCLKVTPAHDMNDFMLGEKHQLEVINMMNDNGTISEAAGFYIGLDRFDCRKQIVADLDTAGHIAKIEDLVNKVGFSERSDAVVEPRLSLQWFVDMKELSKPALDNVMNDNIRFFPPKFKNSYRNWMENIKDWCISRQLWWGHRIPAWYAPNGEIAVAKTEAEALEILQKNTPALTLADIKQDPDVLDTWFSSWLWPISVFDGFYSEDEVKYYYPTNDLVTAPEIMFFWVARMIIAGYEYRGELPFRNVYYTGIVRDKQGRKMSKSLGNSPDPLELMKVYGADGVRVGMLLSSPAGNDLLFDEGLCEQGRNFANKIWNAFRLVDSWKGRVLQIEPEIGSRVLMDWMSERLLVVSTIVDQEIKTFELSSALKYLYRFFYDDFCGYYLELVKPAKDGGLAKELLDHAISSFETILKLLHPIMPFITEEIWQLLDERGANALTITTLPAVVENSAESEEMSIGFWRDENVVHQVLNSLVYTYSAEETLIEGSLEEFELNVPVNIISYHQELISWIRSVRQDNSLSKSVDIFIRMFLPINKVKMNSSFWILAIGGNDTEFNFEPSGIHFDHETGAGTLRFQLTSMVSRGGFYGDMNFVLDASMGGLVNYKSIQLVGFDQFAGSKLTNTQMECTLDLNPTDRHGEPLPFPEMRSVVSGVLNVFPHRNSGNNFASEIIIPAIEIDNKDKILLSYLREALKRENISFSKLEPTINSNEITVESYSNLTNITAFLTFVSDVNVEEIKLKINEELNYIRGFLKSVEAKLNNEKFANNAPAQVLEGERKKQSDALAKIKILEEKLASLAG